MNGISETLKVSKMEIDVFRFTALDIRKYEDQVQISMEDYSKSLKKITDISKANRNYRLINLEMKEYVKVTGKFSWLTQGMRLNFIFTLMQRSKRNNAATIAD